MVVDVVDYQIIHRCFDRLVAALDEYFLFLVLIPPQDPLFLLVSRSRLAGFLISGGDRRLMGHDLLSS